MKKKNIILVLLVIIISSCAIGCGSEGGTKTIKVLLKSSVDKDEKTFQQIVQYASFGNSSNYDKMMEELSEMVNSMGGISNIEFKEYRSKDLKKEIAEEIENEAGKDCVLVHMKGKSNFQYTWLLKKMDGKYYVVNGKDLDIKEILNK